ncbi:hypothetical protein SCA6_011153 [Theobroma cacao]
MEQLLDILPSPCCSAQFSFHQNQLISCDLPVGIEMRSELRERERAEGERRSGLKRTMALS